MRIKLFEDLAQIVRSNTPPELSRLICPKTLPDNGRIGCQNQEQLMRIRKTSCTAERRILVRNSAEFLPIG